MARKQDKREKQKERLIAKIEPIASVAVYPMTYFRCNDGIGGTKTDNFMMISAIHMTQQFVQCTEAEYEEAVTRYNSKKKWDQMMVSPSLK